MLRLKKVAQAFLVVERNRGSLNAFNTDPIRRVKNRSLSTTSKPLFSRCPPINEITKLPKLINNFVIPESFLDDFGHVNIRYYMNLYSDADTEFLRRIGMTKEFIAKNHLGIFTLSHHVHYLRELRAGDNVSVYGKMVGMSGSELRKKIHVFLFMVNHKERDTVASVRESCLAFADLRTRRSSTIPDFMLQRLIELQKEHNNQYVATN